MEPASVLAHFYQGQASLDVPNLRAIVGIGMSASLTPSREHALLKGRRILVVEDEYFLADDIGRALVSLGAEVVGPVGDVGDASDLLNDGGIIDGAVLDVNIRNKMIFPVARELRARGVPIVFTTGYERSTLEVEFGDVPLWEKPIDVPGMTRALARLIQAHQPATR
jgi:CheY-like chemotaxis protein